MRTKGTERRTRQFQRQDELLFDPVRCLLFLAVADGTERLGQVVERRLEFRMLHHARLFRKATQEDHIVEDRAGFEFENGCTHGVETLQTERQPFGHFFARRLVFIELLWFRQQEARLHESEPGRHQQIVGREIHAFRFCVLDKAEILDCQIEDRQVKQIDLLAPGQFQQEMERTFIAIHVHAEDIARLGVLRICRQRIDGYRVNAHAIALNSGKSSWNRAHPA